MKIDCLHPPRLKIFIIPYTLSYSNDISAQKVYRSYLHVEWNISGKNYTSSSISYSTNPVKLALSFQAYLHKPISQCINSLDTADLIRYLLSLRTKVDPGLLCAIDSLVNHFEFDNLGDFVSANQLVLTNSEKLAVMPPNWPAPAVTHQVWGLRDHSLTTELRRIKCLFDPLSLKLKAPSDPEFLYGYLDTVRQFFPEPVTLRVDFNNSLKDFDQLSCCLDILSLFNVACVEDPSPIIDNSIRQLFLDKHIKIMYDSSVLSVESLQNLLLFHQASDFQVNIKLNRIGGFTRALLIDDFAFKNGIETVLGCAEDIGQGMDNIIYLAHRLPSVREFEAFGWDRLRVNPSDLVPFSYGGGPIHNVPVNDLNGLHYDCNSIGTTHYDSFKHKQTFRRLIRVFLLAKLGSFF